VRLWPESAASYTLFISPCIFLFTVHYCALPIEAEGDGVLHAATSPAQSDSSPISPTQPQPLPQTPLSASLRFPFAAVSRQNSSFSTNQNSNSSSKFDTSLFWAILASAVLNATLGACSYVLFGRANHPPQTANGIVDGCDHQKPYMCDNIVKNLSTGPIEVAEEREKERMLICFRHMLHITHMHIVYSTLCFFLFTKMDESLIKQTFFIYISALNIYV
jgi:hypothetical protein